jgi:hypothetical protein
MSLIWLGYPSGEGGGGVIYLFKLLLSAVTGLEEEGGGRHPVVRPLRKIFRPLAKLLVL